MLYRYRNNVRQVRGSALFEFALFFPLFFIFLVVIIDLSLAFLERTAIVQAHRAAANIATATQTAFPVIRNDHNMSTVLDEEAAGAWMDEVLKTYRAELAQFKAFGDASEAAAYFHIALLLVPVNTASGSLLLNTPEDVIVSHTSHPVRPLHALLYQDPIGDSHFFPPADFLQRELSRGAETVPSLYAQPLHRPIATALVTKRYAAVTPLLYIATTAETSGLRRLGVYSFLGRYLSVQEQQLIPLRQVAR